MVNIHGPTSFNDLKTVNGHLCTTYREGCQQLNLLESDVHWDNTLADVSISAHPNQIRTLFAIIISTCYPLNPSELWEKYKDFMTDDILHRLRIVSLDRDMQFTLEMYNEALVLIEDKCLVIANKALAQLGMVAPNRLVNDLFDRELQREQSFNIESLNSFIEENIEKMLPQQKSVYDTIINAINDQCGGIYFLDAPGGTGKTFLISLILATIRSKNDIALAVASSGIAATLLDGGRTAHSAFKLPLNIQYTETPICNISKSSGMGEVLQRCKLIVWDEVTMAHKA